MASSHEVREGIEKILRYPLRNRIQITNEDVRKMREKMNHMNLAEMRSLKEFLTVTPVLTKERVRVGFSKEGKFGAYNIVTECRHKKVLTDQYPSQDKEQTLSLNI